MVIRKIETLQFNLGWNAQYAKGRLNAGHDVAWGKAQDEEHNDSTSKLAQRIDYRIAFKW